MPGVPSNYEFQRDGSEIYKDQQAMLLAKVLGGSPQILTNEVWYFLLLFFLNSWLCWVFDATCRLSLVVVSYSLLLCTGLSLLLIVVTSLTAEH